MLLKNYFLFKPNLSFTRKLIVTSTMLFCFRNVGKISTCNIKSIVNCQQSEETFIKETFKRWFFNLKHHSHLHDKSP